MIRTSSSPRGFGGAAVFGVDALGLFELVFEDDDAIAFGTIEFFAVHFIAIVHGLTDPNAAFVIDVHAGRIDEQRFRRPQGHFQSVGDGEGGSRFLRGKLCRDSGGGEQHGENTKGAKPAVHGGW